MLSDELKSIQAIVNAVPGVRIFDPEMGQSLHSILEEIDNLDRGHDLLLQRCHFFEEEIRDLKNALHGARTYASKAIDKPADEKFDMITDIITNALGDHIDVT